MQGVVLEALQALDDGYEDDGLAHDMTTWMEDLTAAARRVQAAPDLRAALVRYETALHALGTGQV